MPAVGFGTWKIPDGPEAERAVLSALQAGYRLIDTAKVYGNEKSVGRAVAESGIPRDEIFVTTKLANSDQGYKQGLAAFKASLKRLGLDYVDLYLIHWPVSGKRLDSWRALLEIQQTGKAKAVGVSNFTVRHLEELARHTQKMPDVNQIELHPFLYDEQAALLEYCSQQGIVVEAYSPLAHGSAGCLNHPTVMEIARNHGKSSAQVMIRWALQHGAVPLPKSADGSRIRENIDVFDFELSAQDMASLNALGNGMRTCWDPNDME